MDVFSLLDHLGIEKFKGVGISGGGNVLLHLATKQPHRVSAMVLVSATPYFPQQARTIMKNFGHSLPPQEWDRLRRTHHGGDAQIESLLASARAFADSNDDLNFSASDLARIKARTFIIQGDRDPLYPVEISLEMAQAIRDSRLWVIPGAGHGPVIGEKWSEFIESASAFLVE